LSSFFPLDPLLESRICRRLHGVMVRPGRHDR
jgi:hypothetical protein